MEIIWLGHSFFRIRARGATVITDPCPPSTGYTTGKPTADIVTLSHAHDDHTFLKTVAGKPTVIDGAGEYEISGAFVTAIPTYHDEEKGGERGQNLVFLIEMEGVKICHLGDLGHTPTADQAEDMTGADVLMIPVGGGSTIDGAKAAEIVPMLDARIVIPMHYKTPRRQGRPGAGRPLSQGDASDRRPSAAEAFAQLQHGPLRHAGDAAGLPRQERLAPGRAGR